MLVYRHTVNGSSTGCQYYLVIMSVLPNMDLFWKSFICWSIMLLWYVLSLFQQYFSRIVMVSFIGEETRENHLLTHTSLKSYNVHCPWRDTYLPTSLRNILSCWAFVYHLQSHYQQTQKVVVIVLLLGVSIWINRAYHHYSYWKFSSIMFYLEYTDKTKNLECILLNRYYINI
jgi:hypothetical protein